MKTTKMNDVEFIKSLLPRIKEQNKEWWIDLETGEKKIPPIEEKLVLVYTELAEAVEAYRKDLNDDHLPHRNGVEVELADAVIRWLDFYTGYDKDFKIEFHPKWSFYWTPLETFMCLFTLVNDFYEFEEKGDFNYFLWIVFEFCAREGYDLQGAIIEKLDYNKTRKDHTLEARKEKNGKKF